MSMIFVRNLLDLIRMEILDFSLFTPLQTTLAPLLTTTIAAKTTLVSDAEFDSERALLLVALYSCILIVLISLLVVSFLMYRRQQHLTRSNKNANAASIEDYLFNPWAASASIFAASNGDVSLKKYYY